MPKEYKTIIEYIQENYYDEIIDAIRWYVFDTQSYLDEDLFINADTINLEVEPTDYKILSSSFFKAGNDGLDFDLYVNGDVGFRYNKNGKEKLNGLEVAFTLTCKGNLCDGQMYFEIVSIVEGNHLRPFDKNNSLSKFLVPYVTKDQYEFYANQFLKLFCSEALVKPVKLDVAKIAAELGLMIKIGYFKGNNILGKIIYCTEKVLCYDFDKQEYYEDVAEPGTIFINRDIVNKFGYGALNNTVIHECVHWFMHRRYFELAKLIYPKETALTCYEEIKKSQVDLLRNKCFIELQARAIAPQILMPTEMAIKKFDEILKETKKDKKGKNIRKWYLQALSIFANYFGVSLESAKIRLSSLGYTELIGSLRNVNGDNIKAYHVKDNNLRYGETYTIDFEDAVTIINNNPTFKALMLQNRFVYVDGFFVINDSRYIKRFKKCGARLRTVALRDVSKCCLIFDTINRAVRINYDPNHFNIMQFHSGDSKFEYTNECFYPEEAINNQVVTRNSMSSETSNLINEATLLVDKLSEFKTFSEKLDYVLENADINTNKDYNSERALSKVIGISDKTLASYRNGDSRPDLKRVLRICASLRLFPPVTLHLVGALGFDLTRLTESPYPTYLTLISICYLDGVEKWNVYIKQKYPNQLNYCL